MEKIFTVESISLIITFISFVFALWQYKKNQETKHLIALEAIEMHNNVAIALGATQAAKSAIDSGNSPAYQIGRAEGVCQTLLHESAKLYCNLANSKVDNIDDLISTSQFDIRYKDLYYSYSGRKRGFLSLKLKDIYRKYIQLQLFIIFELTIHKLDILN